MAAYRKQRRIRAFSAQAKEQNDWMTQAATATSPMSMTRLVQIGIIPAQQPHPGMPSVIKQSDLATQSVQRAVKQLKTSNNRPLSQVPDQLNLFEFNDL